ncbi:hypothetical protein CDU00_13320, partial [Cronobacter sakazakii]
MPRVFSLSALPLRTRSHKTLWNEDYAQPNHRSAPGRGAAFLETLRARGAVGAVHVHPDAARHRRAGRPQRAAG